jgi:hypothetical protein
MVLTLKTEICGKLEAQPEAFPATTPCYTALSLTLYTLLKRRFFSLPQTISVLHGQVAL